MRFLTNDEEENVIQLMIKQTGNVVTSGIDQTCRMYSVMARLWRETIQMIIGR